VSVPAASLPRKAAVHSGLGVGLKRLLGPDHRMGYLFVTPIFLLVLSLVAYPFCYAIYLSMTHKLVGLPPVFVGFENYIRLTWDGFFQRAVVNSFIFTFGSVGFKLVLGVVMALVLMSPIRWRSFWTGVLLIPWVAPTVVSALNFLWIFDGSLGVLNYLLVRVFRILPQGVGWLSEPGTAMASVVAVNIWRGFPFFGISFLAGMKAIPAELYEAAAVDGAGAWRIAWSVKLPALRPALMLTLVFSVIGSSQLFNEPNLLQRLAPAVIDSAYTANLYAYSLAFISQQINYAAAVSFLLGLVIVIVSYAVLLTANRRRTS
jgi:multiple sugar transport system permease protein